MGDLLIQLPSTDLHLEFGTGKLALFETRKDLGCAGGRGGVVTKILNNFYFFYREINQFLGTKLNCMLRVFPYTDILNLVYK